MGVSTLLLLSSVSVFPKGVDDPDAFKYDVMGGTYSGLTLSGSITPPVSATSVLSSVSVFVYVDSSVQF